MASFDYNPITGQLDLVGSGGGSYIDGEVEYHSNLPVTVGTPAVNSAFLVRKGEGLYFISRKPAGIWVRELNNGNLDDWKYAGTFSDLYRDANFRILNNTDVSKELAFDVSGVTTGTTRTLTVPNASGTIARTEDFAAPPAIGSTTRNTGAFTTLSATPASGSALTLTGGTVTASTPLIDATQTWNNAAVTFTGLRLNATNTASASASLLADFQVGGTSQFSVRRDGRVNCNSITVGGVSTMDTGAGQLLIRNAVLGWDSNAVMIQNTDLQLFRDAADTLAQRRTTNPQTFRLYNTFTDASNYERGFMRWSSNVFQIGTEKGGTGSARALEFQTDGTTRITIATDGGVGLAGNITAANYINQSGGVFVWASRLRMYADADGRLRLSNNAQTDFDRLQFGGTTSSFPALKRSSTTLQVRLADDSAFAPFECAGLTLNGNLTASTRNIVTDTTTGTRIGTGTTQLLGFWNATPAAQPAAVADATDAASTQARLNDLLARLRTIGIIAT